MVIGDWKYTCEKCATVLTGSPDVRRKICYVCNTPLCISEDEGINSTPPPVGDYVAGWEWALGP
eukprot:g72603.t1